MKLTSTSMFTIKYNNAVGIAKFVVVDIAPYEKVQRFQNDMRVFLLYLLSHPGKRSILEVWYSYDSPQP